jgi:hypothetical protein
MADEDDKALQRQALIAQALKDKIPLAAQDPTSQIYDNLDSSAYGFKGALDPANKSEQAGVMYVDADGKYRMSIPTTQRRTEGFALRMQPPEGSKAAGIFHTHPGNDADSQMFSPNDLAVADKLKIPSYVMFTKTGEIRRYTPGVTKTHRVYIPGSQDQDYAADGDKVVDPATMVAALRAQTP